VKTGASDPRSWEALFSDLRTPRANGQEPLQNLLRSEGSSRLYSAGTEIVGIGDSYDASYLVLRGWAFCARVLPDGRRQIIDFMLPGDFACVEVVLHDVAAHSFQAVTDVEALRFSPERTHLIFTADPDLRRMVNLNIARQASILAERLMTIGRRSAYERTIHLFLELWTRLKRIGEADESGFRMPLTQELLADTLGLSTIHVNRTLQRLRKDGLFEVHSGTLSRVRVLNVRAATRIANFDPGYLHYDQTV
jgi:CRP-like cAMP-binding protein